MKYSKLLFVFITVLGMFFISTFLAFLYCNYYLDQDIWLELFPSYYLTSIVGYFLLFGGPVFLIVGILGIGRQHFKNHKNLFTVLTIVLVPLFNLYIDFSIGILCTVNRCILKLMQNQTSELCSIRAENLTEI